MTKSAPAAQERRSTPRCRRTSLRQLFWVIFFFVSLGVGTAVLRRWTPPTRLRYLVPAVPLLAGLFYMRALVDDIRRQMDELQLRIYLEAAAVVVCGLFIILLSYPLLEAALLVGPLDYSVGLCLIVLLGIVGYVSAVRRYR